MNTNLLLFKTVIAGDSWGVLAVPVIETLGEILGLGRGYKIGKSVAQTLVFCPPINLMFIDLFCFTDFNIM